MKNVLSLFSGCGGMDLGFEGDFTVFQESVNTKIHPKWVSRVIDDKVLLCPTGFKTIFSNDILPVAANAWQSYFSSRHQDNVYLTDSIVDLVKKHKSGESIFPEKVDVVTGGFPCQDFSLAGKRQGFASHKNHFGKVADDISAQESRGSLYLWMKEVISITKPKIFFAENVKGLISLGDAKKIIENDFAAIDDNGYYVYPARVLNAGQYGVPQKRERIIFIGLNIKHLKPGILEKIKNNELDLYPPITHNIHGNTESDLFSATNLLPMVTTQIAFRGLSEPDVSLDVSQQTYSRAKYIPKGQGNTEVSPHGLGPTIRAEHHGNIEFRRLSAENGGKNTTELACGLPQRRLTVRECARIQTFPDDYKFVQPNVSGSGAYKIIGNAVPPLLAYNIAKHISEIWHILFGEDV